MLMYNTFFLLNADKFIVPYYHAPNQSFLETLKKKFFVHLKIKYINSLN